MNRSKSFTKKRSEIKLESLKKIEPEGVVLLKNKLLNMGKKNRNKQNVTLFSGSAYLDVRDKYELIDLNKGNHNYDIETGIKTKGASGYEGTVTQWRNKETGELCAVKLEETNMLKRNKNKNMVDFYKEYKSGHMDFKKAKWAVRQIDRIADDKKTYTIQEWIEGKTLTEWYKDLRNEPSLAIKIRKIAHVMRQINNYLNDITKKNLIDLDLHEDNIMITPDGIMKNVDFCCKENYEEENYTERNNATRLGRNLRGAMEAINIGSLMNEKNTSEKYQVYLTIKSLLDNDLGYEITNVKGIWTTKPKTGSYDKFNYTSQKREHFVSQLEELAKRLKK